MTKHGLEGRSQYWGAPTQNSAGCKWVATDESGWDGEQLLHRADRFMTLGSVAIADDEAAEVVAELRSRTRSHQSPELKFSQFKTSARQHELARIIREQLAGRTRVYFVDKIYMASGKMVDLFIEEAWASRGRSLHVGGLHVAMARALAVDGPGALPDGLFDRLLMAVVQFASRRNVGGAEMSVDDLMGVFDNAHKVRRDGDVRSVLAELLQTRAAASDVLERVGTADPFLEPLIPVVGAVVADWAARLGQVNILTDEHIELGDRQLELIATFGSLDFDRERASVSRRAFRPQVVRGRSIDHPSIQLADLLAGAGLAVSRDQSQASGRVASSLRDAVMESYAENSLVPHDDTTRIALCEYSRRWGPVVVRVGAGVRIGR